MTHRLTYRDAPYGPEFPSREAAQAFARWVANRSGLAFSQQSEATLERLKEIWKREQVPPPGSRA